MLAREGVCRVYISLAVSCDFLVWSVALLGGVFGLDRDNRLPFDTPGRQWPGRSWQTWTGHARHRSIK